MTDHEVRLQGRISQLENQLQTANDTIKSIATILGWMNVPPRETLERDLVALKFKFNESFKANQDYITACAAMIEGEGLLTVKIKRLQDQLLGQQSAFDGVSKKLVEAQEQIAEKRAVDSVAAEQIKSMRKGIQHIQNWIHSGDRETDLQLQAEQSGRNVCEWIVEYAQRLREQK